MSRAASRGRLFLGFGKASASAITMISEEFGPNTKIKLDHVCDLVIGAIVKRRAQGNMYRHAILSEGLLENIGQVGLKEALCDLNRYGEVEHDDHGPLRLGEIEFGRLLQEPRQKASEETRPVGDDHRQGHEVRAAPTRSDSMPSIRGISATAR